MNDEKQSEERRLDEDAKQAVEEARAHLSKQYAAFGIEPEVHVVEVCGLVAVCLPWSLQKRNLALRQVSRDSTAADLAHLNESRVRDTLFWIRGQQADGPGGAVKHIRDLANLGGRYMNIMDAIAEACGEIEKGAAGGKAEGKKL